MNTHTITPHSSERYDLLSFLANVKEDISNFLKTKTMKHALKWYLSVQVEMQRDTPEGDIQVSVPHFRSRVYITLTEDAFSEHDLNEALYKISESLENYIRNASGWRVSKVLHLIIHTVLYQPISGSNYIDLPETLSKGHAVLNIRNNDNKCFFILYFSSIEAFKTVSFRR